MRVVRAFCLALGLLVILPSAGYAAGASIRWRPGIGDPTVMGWITVVAYACGAVMALVANQSDPSNEDARQRRVRKRLWLAVAFMMTCLCFNKQLDLQTLFTDIGRVIAYDQGWYNERRGVQKAFILLVLAGAAVCGGWFIWRFHGFWRNHKLLLAGSLFLLTFVVVRAISFHHVDEFLGHEVAGVRMNWALELGGIALINLAAIQEWRRRSTGTPNASRL